ncbi:hypothetical protein PTTG_25418 [Puccinia triticina 1-1 BBBD Race 1]|uniref:Uncharacterized protein n=1 Tax=Puccinia triticina (isolate 1-1 / race 1 (BBBD)) TaxID=630390 RepID=A0A180H2Z2_PUCT1|nr:hypothetical protein PTTG_25418 [Puccinia triticina 1-1 BBBD Race 1]
MESNHPFLARITSRPSQIPPNPTMNAPRKTLSTALPDDSDDFVDPSLRPSLQSPPISPATIGSALNNPAVTKTQEALTPDEEMEKYKKKTLRELRELQHTHIKYKKLNQAIKTEAENIYFEYQKKQHLLSLKYSRPFALLTKYLGQRRTRQQESCWDSFRKNNPDAQEALHNTENNIGQRNKEVSKLYKQATSTNNPNEIQETNSQADATNTSDTAERGIFNKIFKSSEKLRAETRSWAKGVQQQLKEFSDLFGMEGFLVLAGQDHQNPFFFQGGSIHGDDFLKGLIDEGDPMREFAIWTAGQKTNIKKKQKKPARPLASGSALQVASQPRSKKTKLNRLAFKNQDVCQGSLALNHKYICCKLREIYEEVQTNSKKKDTRGWPGTNTAFQLANFNRKLVVKENTVGLTSEHLLNVPIKNMPIKVTWLVLRGLKNNWITLAKHRFDTPPKQTGGKKRKASEINEEEEDGNDGEDQGGNTEDKGDDEEVYGEDDNE